MTFTATVVRVMIASPSDVGEARDAVEKALHDWNGTNACSRGVVLLPWRWERDAVPIQGGHPQALINAQGVDESDIVIGLFGSRLGSPTLAAVSGTVEEIGRAEAAGKPVHLYFSTAPLAHDVDTMQLDGLRELKRELQGRGLLGEFTTPTELTLQVWHAVERDLEHMELAPASSTTRETVRWLVQREREPDGRGNMQTAVYITNNADYDAENVTFTPSQGMHLSETGPTVVHAKQRRRLSAWLSMGAGPDPVIQIAWDQDGARESKDFHI